MFLYRYSKIVFIILFVGLHTAAVKAQKTDPPKKITFVDKAPKKPKTTKYVDDNKTLLKFELKPSRGYFLTGIEKNIFSNFSLDLEVGLTYLDVISSLVARKTDPLLAYPVPEIENAEVFQPFGFTVPKIGTMMAGTLKYYPSPDYVLEGNSIGLYFAYKKLRNSTEGYYDLLFDTPTEVKEIALLYARQNKGSYIFNEWYIGLGCRFYKTDFLYLRNGRNSDNSASYATVTKNFTVPMIIAGYKFSFKL